MRWRITAEWQDDGAREIRDVILLIAGTLLGTAGAALIEWVKSIQRGLQTSGTITRRELE
jgi:hypothetical protein